MALVDTRRDKYFDMAKKRWREQGFDAGIEDILEEYRADKCRQIASNKVNVLTTFLMNLYDCNNIQLQKDITKLIIIQPAIDDFPPDEKRKLLRVLWSVIQSMYEDDWSEVLNEINLLAEWDRRNKDEDYPIR